MVVQAPIDMKRYYNQNDGYIIWDGGVNRSIRLTYFKPRLSPSDPLFPALKGEETRFPIYMTNARNITIKNCIIEDGYNQDRSRH